MANKITSTQKIKLNESEQELYDALLDEYNDIFENILNISEKTMFDKILENVKAILGPKKMISYSKMSIANALSYLKLTNYSPDIMSLRHLKEIMISLGTKDPTNKIHFLNIDDIFSHCKECSKCYHTCGEVLLKPTAFDFIICLKCRMVYKKELIHLYCNECKEEYYSYILDDSEPEYEDYYPATWEKYHCPNFIYEEMVCPSCDAMLYYNENNDLLKCFECNWKCKAKNKKWICEICDTEFNSEVKEYIRFETKPMVNCVRDALVQKIIARPAEMSCCWEDPVYYTFIHEEKGCKGILYIGILQKKQMVVCSECRLVQDIKDVCWWCPNCKSKFFCRKIKYDRNNKNVYMIKPKSLLKNDTGGLFRIKKTSYCCIKNEKGKENDNVKNKKMEKSITSDILKPKTKFTIIHKNNDKNKYLLIKNDVKYIKSNKENNKTDGNSSIKNNYNYNIEDMEKSISDDYDSGKIHKQIKSKIIISNFYKKQKNWISNNLDLKKDRNFENEKNKDDENSMEKNGDEPIVSSDDEIEKYNVIKNTNKISLKSSKTDKVNFYARKREISVNKSTNLSLRQMKIISLNNQKYINKSKIQFDKSINIIESNIASINNHKNIYSDSNNLINIKNKAKDIDEQNLEKGINLNVNFNININNYLARSRSIKNYYTIENRLRNKTFSQSYLNIKDVGSLNNKVKTDEKEPNEHFIPEEFKTINQIGEGSFGKIYTAEWTKNKKLYAMKKMILRNKAAIKKNQDQTDLVFDLVKQKNMEGVIKVYGSQCIKINNSEFHFYVLMELAETDWDKEIKTRKQQKKYYTEGELYDILRQLTKTFAFLQKNNITHRDIKPQNILVVNKVYKICDFGEAKVTDGNDVIHQSIKGTELYMSPILFRALNKRQKHIIHNTYKSDVFSLGMCLFLAATLSFQSLYDIRELRDMRRIRNVLVKYLISKYSYDFVQILIKLLEYSENLRPDFIELEKILSKK